MSKNLLSFQNVAVAATTPSKSTRIPIPDSLRRPILVRSKILMGSGLTNPSPRVTEALSKPIMGVHDVEIGKVEITLYLYLFFSSSSLLLLLLILLLVTMFTVETFIP